MKELLAAELPTGEAYHKRAHRFEKFGQWKLAIGDLNRAIAQMPGDNHLQISRAGDHLQLGEFAEAIADLERVEDVDKIEPEMCNALAWILLTARESLRNPSKALSLAQRAAQSRPDDRSYRNTLGLAYYRSGEFAKALGVLELNVKTDDLYIAFDYVLMAMCRHRMGQVERARVDFNRAAREQRRLRQTDPRDETEFRSLLTEAKAVLAGLSSAGSGESR
jgi:tetratricopeptide (TPR) repeat protein